MSVIKSISAGVRVEWNADVQVEPGSVPDYRNRYGDSLRPDGLHIRVRRWPAASLPSFPGARLAAEEPDDVDVTIRGAQLKKDGTPGKRGGSAWIPDLGDLPGWAFQIVEDVLRDFGLAEQRRAGR